MRKLLFALLLVSVLSTVALAQEFPGPGGCEGPLECKEYCSQQGNAEECRRFFQARGPATGASSTRTAEGPLMGGKAEIFGQIKTGEMEGPGGCSGPRECMVFCQKEENYNECQEFAKKHGFSSSTLKEIHHYENIDPNMMVANKIFSKADLNPKDFIQYCPDAETMVDAAIAQLKEKGLWNIQAACSAIDEDLATCREKSNNCKNILDEDQETHMAVGEKASEFGRISCSKLSEETLYQECIAQHQDFITKATDAGRCEQLWEEKQKVSGEFCERELVCEKDAYVAKLQSERETHCKEVQEKFGSTDEEYQTCLNEVDYEARWSVQQARCESTDEVCDKDAFIARCSSQGVPNAAERMDMACRDRASHLYQTYSEVCERRKFHYEMCLERVGQACTFLEKASEACQDATEESVRAAMIKQAERMCEFKEVAEEKTVALGGKDVSSFVKLLQEARDEAPDEYKAVIEAKTEEIVDTAETVTETEKGKGIGYTLSWFVGAAADSEKRDAVLLRESAEKLQTAVDTLKLAIDEVQSETLKTAIETQIKDLEKQIEELNKRADEKEKRAKGLFSYLG